MVDSIDLGCGYNWRRTEEHNWSGESIGIDLNKEKVDYCNSKLKGCFFVDDVWNVDYGKWQRITAYGCFEYIFEFEKLLEKIFNEMKKGSTLTFTVPNATSLRKRLRIWVGKSPNISKLPSRVYTWKFIHEIVSKHNWGKIVIGRLDGYYERHWTDIIKEVFIPLGLRDEVQVYLEK